jgi:uncharacterized lipoprotein YmbA
MIARFAPAAAMALLLAACAGPPLTLYTLAPPAPSPQAPLASPAVVIQVARVTVPDALDSQDLLVRSGNTLNRSATGRWATRLSVAITDLLTARLAQILPAALVTDQPQAETPTYRLSVHISRFDIAAPGTASVAADWLILPRDPALPPRRGRVAFTETGRVATDQDVVALTQRCSERVADAIDVAELREGRTSF